MASGGPPMTHQGAHPVTSATPRTEWERARDTCVKAAGLFLFVLACMIWAATQGKTYWALLWLPLVEVQAIYLSRACGRAARVAGFSEL